MAIIAPHVAAQFMIKLLAKRITDLVAESNKLIQEKGSFEMLEVLHHFTSGYKAYTTNIAYRAMDDLRQSCGGAGYLLSSGIANI